MGDYEAFYKETLANQEKELKGLVPTFVDMAGRLNAQEFRDEELRGTSLRYGIDLPDCRIHSTPHGKIYLEEATKQVAREMAQEIVKHYMEQFEHKTVERRLDAVRRDPGIRPRD